jgi:formylglycine-generating enzyme required for sulfatase activity
MHLTAIYLIIIGLLALLGRGDAATPPSRDLIIEEMRQEQRIALVIGNAAYSEAPLKNPVNDARAMAAVLKTCGFEVITRLNSDKQSMFESIREFGRRIQNGGVGLFYYAGHGMQVQGRNYLVPVDTDIKAEDEVEFQCIDADLVLRKMESASNRVNIVVLDACRNNPFARSFRSAARGLGQMDAATGSILAYATAPGMVAADGEGDNGLYTEALLNYIARPGLRIEQVFKSVRRDIVQGTGRAQIPWESSSLTGEFYFVLPQTTAPLAAAVLPAPPPPVLAGHLQVNVNAPQASILVNGTYRGQAEPGVPLNLTNLGRGTMTVRVEAPGHQSVTQPYVLVANQWTQAVFSLTPASSPSNPPSVTIPTAAPSGATSAIPVQFAPASGHMVQVGDSLLIDLTEVSNADFAAFLNRRGNQSVDGEKWALINSENSLLEMRDGFFAPQAGFDNHPVVGVSWHGAEAYCAWTGKHLPTETQWQQTCGQSTYPWGEDIDRVKANYGSENCCGPDTADGYQRTAPVGAFPNGASPSGALDMAGNVWEWTATAQGKVRIVRGGSWSSSPEYLACAYQHGLYPNERHPYVGFRCAR